MASSMLVRTAVLAQRPVARRVAISSPFRWSDASAWASVASTISGPNPLWRAAVIERRSLATASAGGEGAETKSKGVIGWMKDKWDDRSKKSEADKVADQMRVMANTEVWDLQKFADEMESSVSGWRSKIPGMSSVPQVKKLKATQKLVRALLAEMGGDVTASQLARIGRKEKLKISVASGQTVEDINVLIKQFQSVEMMHSVLRYRKLNGKPLPEDEDSMKLALQEDGAKVLSKQQKKEMQRAHARMHLGVGRHR